MAAAPAAVAAGAAGTTAGSGCTRARDELGRQYVHTVRARAGVRAVRGLNAHIMSPAVGRQPTADWPDIGPVCGRPKNHVRRVISDRRCHP